MPRALITGITGQDGSYLTELLLSKGYEVHGIIRPGRSPAQSHLAHLVSDPGVYQRRLFLHFADLDDSDALREAVQRSAPDELYHLAAPSRPGLSFKFPEAACSQIGVGTVRLLEAVRTLSKPPRFFHASSSEVFGRPEAQPQDETTPFRPVTPYGAAKALASQMVSIYRDAYGLFACNGILYNHESPRRGEDFVTQKVCRTAAAIKLGRATELQMGSLAGRRDWGDAREYVRGMWLALQHDTPGDYVFATGQLHSVQDVVEIAFDVVGLDWKQ
ncbi:MAG TPA: GDP-mannose 4,6-dehydratase, partial [Verrucomicrobiota bacterium]|nr:GDP-mannose 4,6-dehydratase [Verrucomicrobiota bacterium]